MDGWMCRALGVNPPCVHCAQNTSFITYTLYEIILLVYVCRHAFPIRQMLDSHAFARRIFIESIDVQCNSVACRLFFDYKANAWRYRFGLICVRLDMIRICMVNWCHRYHHRHRRRWHRGYRHQPISNWGFSVLFCVKEMVFFHIFHCELSPKLTHSSYMLCVEMWNRLLIPIHRLSHGYCNAHFRLQTQIELSMLLCWIPNLWPKPSNSSWLIALVYGSYDNWIKWKCRRISLFSQMG